MVGHDFGSPVAAWCALIRPDVFRSRGADERAVRRPAAAPFGTADSAAPDADMHDALAALPRPRKHYQWYYSTRPANADMWQRQQGVHAFLRAYYHHKSADWTETSRSRSPAGRPTSSRRCRPTTSWTSPTHGRDGGQGDALARRDRGLPLAARGRAAVYSDEYARTGFQGGLNGTAAHQRAHSTASCRSSPAAPSTCRRLHRRRAATGASTSAGRAERDAGTRLHAHARLPSVEGAGHWVQQEQPEEVNRLLLDFLKST